MILLDVRAALRSFRSSPTFTLTAVATLALGIGTTAAIFSMVDAVLFRPLPYQRPERLVRVSQTMRAVGIGIVFGILGAFALTRAISSLLFGVAATDLPSFSGAIALLTGVALAAGYLPVRRALRMDPAEALRF